jgi:hypothetical protein
MQTKLNNKLLALASMHNLNWLIEFHNYVRGLFKDQLHGLEKYENNDLEYIQLKNALYDYDRTLHTNTFLMMYSYLEEWLYHGWKAYAPNIKLINGEGSISRFKNVLKQLGVDLSSKHWQTLMEVEEIRNCLLHANGRLRLLKDSQKVKRIINKKDSKLSIVKDRVVISGEYLQLFNENISYLMNIIYKSHI